MCQYRIQPVLLFLTLGFLDRLGLMDLMDLMDLLDRLGRLGLMDRSLNLLSQHSRLVLMDRLGQWAQLCLQVLLVLLVLQHHLIQGVLAQY